MISGKRDFFSAPKRCRGVVVQTFWGWVHDQLNTPAGDSYAPFDHSSGYSSLVVLSKNSINYECRPFGDVHVIFAVPGQGQVLVGEIPSASKSKTCGPSHWVPEPLGWPVHHFHRLKRFEDIHSLLFFLESVQSPFCWSWNPNQSLFIHWGEPINYVDLAPSIRGYIPYFCSLKYSKIAVPVSWPPFSASPHNTWSLARGSWLRESGSAKAANLRWKSSKRNPTWISRMIFPLSH